MTILDPAKREARINALATRLQGEVSVLREYLHLIREEIIYMQMQDPALEPRGAAQLAIITSILRAVTPLE